MDDLNFGSERFVKPLSVRKDLITSKEHEFLFSTFEPIKDVLISITKGQKNRDSPETLVQSYKSNLDEFIAVFRIYFQNLKLADHIILNKTHHPEFIKFISMNSSPTNQLIFNNFIHKPLEFYNNVIQNFGFFMAQYPVNSPYYKELEDLLMTLKVRKISEKKTCLEFFLGAKKFKNFNDFE